jgi:inorganic triphosphatase YgiF
MDAATPHVATERELKLSAWPQFVLPDLERAVKGARAAPPAVSRLEATYLDTPDLRLLRRGVTLRFRRGEAGGDIWTLKLPAEAATFGLARREISLPGPPGALPRLLRDLTRGWAFGAPLRRVATIRTTHTTTSLFDSDAHQVATIDDDDVCGLHGGRVAARFREIEVELAPNAPRKTLRALAKALTAAGAMPAPQVPKLARTLGRAAQEPWDLAAPDPGARPTTSELVCARLVDAVSCIVDHHAAVVLDEDPSAMRRLAGGVATLRGDLRVFQPILDAEVAGSLGSGLDHLARRLDALCDQDARLASIRADAAGHDVGRGASAVVAALENDRARTRERVLALMRGASYGALLAGLRDLAMDPPLAGGKAKRRATTVVPTIAAAEIRRLKGDVLRYDQAPLDDLAGPIGELRHAVELATQFAGKPAAKAAHDVQQVADLVWQLRRSRATAARLQVLARETDAQQAWAAGVLAGRQLAQVDAAAARIPTALRELARRTHWAWLD